MSFFKARKFTEGRHLGLDTGVICSEDECSFEKISRSDSPPPESEATAIVETSSYASLILKDIIFFRYGRISGVKQLGDCNPP